MQPTIKIEKAMLVYQAGIANVFKVTEFGLSACGQDGQYRDRRRLLQADFRTCEDFARGLNYAGTEVRSCACNRAGDIAASDWEEDLGPIRTEMRPINPTTTLRA